MKVNSRLGQQIKYLRKMKQLTQPEFGKAIGLSQQAIVGIETGKRGTTVTKLVEIADYFDVSLDFLVGRNHTSRTDPEESVVNHYYNLQKIQDINKAAMQTAKALRVLAQKLTKISGDKFEPGPSGKK